MSNYDDVDAQIAADLASQSCGDPDCEVCGEEKRPEWLKDHHIANTNALAFGHLAGDLGYYRAEFNGEQRVILAVQVPHESGDGVRVYPLAVLIENEDIVKDDDGRIADANGGSLPA